MTKINYMPFEVFYTDACDYVQMPGRMPLAICSEFFDKRRMTLLPDKDNPIAYVLSPEQFEKVKHLLLEDTDDKASHDIEKLVGMLNTCREVIKSLPEDVLGYVRNSQGMVRSIRDEVISHITTALEDTNE